MRDGKPEQLGDDAYLDDFYRVFDEDIRRFDKLERGQTFKEPGYASWEMFASGEWRRAVSLIEDDRASLSSYYQGMANRGLVARRVRVYELPVTPYLQWEMHVLRLRAELGEDVRLLNAADVREYERETVLPELVILGDDVMYEVLYTQDGIGSGARKFTNPSIISKCSGELDILFRQAEGLPTFFEREIAPLKPPALP